MSIFPSLEDDDYRIVSLDPSSTNLGICCVETNLSHSYIKVLDARTFYGKDAVRGLGDQKGHHELRYLRNKGVSENFAPYLERFQPYAVCAEDPHLRFLTAYRALVEQLTLLKETLWDFDASMAFHFYRSSPVKRFIGVSGGSQNKLDIPHALAKMSEVTFADGIELDQLDEHQCDAIAVAIYHAHHARFPWLVS